MNALRSALRCGLALVLAVAPGGCAGIQSALDAHGVEAGAIAWLIWIFTAVCAAVWLLVMLALALGLLRRRRIADAPLGAHYGTGRTRVIATFTLLTGVIVIALSVLSYLTDKSLATPGPAPLTVTLIGHQWWWEIRYDDPDPSRSFTTANELHLPAGVQVKLSLQSTDVIHSFWVPSLAGKEDLIPGWKNDISFTPQSPGLYRGQCAEFCGLQHAHMGLLVAVQTRAEFDAWYAAQVAPAAMAAAPDVKRGHDVFMRSGCILCHAIRGTRAGGRVGPDLTHVGSRMALAADALPLSRDTLALWIANPQGVKPGANMPRVKLADADLKAVARYLESLR